MKVAIRTDSSNLIGSGHIMRCLTLADLLKKEGHEVFFVCRNLPFNSLNIIDKRGFKSYLLSYSDEQKETYLKNPINDDYNLWFGVSVNRDIEDTVKVIKDKYINLLVVDSYSLDSKWESKIRPYCKHIMVIDDLANRKHDCDFILDHNFYSNINSRYDELVPKHCKKLLGPKYALLNLELKKVKEAREKRTYNNVKEIKNILVFLGGSDPKNFTEKVLIDALKNDSLRNAIFNVVLGANNRYKTKLKIKFAKYDNVIFHIHPEYYYELLEKADIAFGSGGVSQLERMYICLPSIILKIAENQKKVTDDCLEHKYALDFFKSIKLCLKKINLKKLNVKLFNVSELLNI